MNPERLSSEGRFFRGFVGVGLTAIAASAHYEGDLRNKILGTAIALFNAYLQTEAITGEAPLENLVYRMRQRKRYR